MPTEVSENVTIRELMGSMREGLEANTRENVALRGDVLALKEAVEGLTHAIRGNGDKGLVRNMDAIQESQRIIATKIDTFEHMGTPPSQMQLMRLRDKDAAQDVAITKVEARLEREEERGDKRRWQIVILFVSSCIGVLGMAVSLALHFLQPK